MDKYNVIQEFVKQDWQRQFALSNDSFRTVLDNIHIKIGPDETNEI